MKRSLETDNLVDLGDDDDVVFSAANDPTATSTITTKVKTRWLKNGQNEGALMTLNLRELRDEAKRLGFEATYSKVDTKDKYVTYLHKKYSALRKSGSQTSQATEEDVENQPQLKLNKKEKEPEPEPEPVKLTMEVDPPPKEKASSAEAPAEPKAKKSKKTKSTEVPETEKPTTEPAAEPQTKKPKKVAAICDKVAAAVAAVMTSKSGPAAGKRAKKTAKSPAGPKHEKPSEDELKIIAKLEEFFGAKKNTKSGLPENDWCCVSDLDTLPLINVKGYTIQYPCDQAVCRMIIESSSSHKDKTWLLEPDDLDIQSAPWLAMFKDSKSSPFLDDIRKKLAPNCKKISAKLHKLVVYEKGSFFKTNAKEAQKRDDHHFGTIVVFLPSFFKGGDLTVRHIDKERTCSFSYSNDDLKNETLKCRAFSFFTDCEHEAKPVESDGYRVALIYNLSFEGDVEDRPVLPASITEAESKLNALLMQVFNLPTFQKNKKKIGIVLQNDYPVSTLKTDCLKDADKVIFDAFKTSGSYEIELTPIAVDAQGCCGDDDASEPAKEYYDESIEQGYETKFKIRRRDLAELIEREERRKNRKDDDSEEEDEDGDSCDEDYHQGEVLSDFTWNYSASGWGKGDGSPPPVKGSVQFVGDWRKVAIGKICAAGTTPTHSTGTEFELQFHAAAMLVKPKDQK